MNDDPSYAGALARFQEKLNGWLAKKGADESEARESVPLEPLASTMGIIGLWGSVILLILRLEPVQSIPAALGLLALFLFMGRKGGLLYRYGYANVVFNLLYFGLAVALYKYLPVE